MLWNSISLLHHGGGREKRLAERIILNTPIDSNGFEPIAAIEVLLCFGKVLPRKAAAHLQAMVEAHLANCVEKRFGSEGCNNFTCMETYLFLGAAQVLERYKWDHPLAGIPEIYTKDRVRAAGMNALRLLHWHAGRESVFGEFNSPTYSPISAMALAKIVEQIPDAEARHLALEVEMKLWRELLALWHPGLSLPCGPWSRAYRVDAIGQNSQMRLLMTYLGLSCDKSIPKLLDPQQEGVKFHHQGDVPFCWSGPAWQMNTRYHVPTDALAELRSRSYPRVFEAPIRWDAHGMVDKRRGKLVPVQGGLVAGGESEIWQQQHANWSIGCRRQCAMGHSFGINLHYALTPKVRSMRDVRSVTAAVVCHDVPEEWVTNALGRRVESDNLSSIGAVRVEGRGRTLRFTAAPLRQFAPIPAGELSVNTCIAVHFGDSDAVTLNGRPYEGEPIEIVAKQAVCCVRDAGFAYEIEYVFPKPVTIRLWRWANFIRFAGFWYRGARKRHSEAALRRLRMSGVFRVRKVRSPSQAAARRGS